MIKKQITILLTIVYSLFAVGVNLHQHYCSSQLAFTEIIAFNKVKTCGCDPLETNDCCKDVHQYLIVKDSQQITSLTSFNTSFSPFILNEFTFLNIPMVIKTIENRFFEWPPGWVKIPKFILLRAMRL